MTGAPGDLADLTGGVGLYVEQLEKADNVSEKALREGMELIGGLEFQSFETIAALVMHLSLHLFRESIELPVRTRQSLPFNVLRRNLLLNLFQQFPEDGMSYGDDVEQLAYLLFLKMADERTKPPYNQPSAVPAKYNWPTLLKKDGDEHKKIESGRTAPMTT